MTDQAQIERDVRVPAPPDRVWQVITGPGWLGEQVQLDLVPGGAADFGERTGWIEEATPPVEAADGSGRLVFWWSQDEAPASRVELILEPDGEHATRLRVIESRPLDVLDVTGIPLGGGGGSAHGPSMLALA